MNSRTFLSMALALCIAAGCTNLTTSGGTETGNPDIRACAKKMSKAALEALHTHDEWKPAHYLDTSIIAQKTISAQFSTHALSKAGMFKTVSAKSDTVIVNDSFAMVYDTVVYYDTVIGKDTVFVNKTLHRDDTIADTLSSLVENGTIQTIRVQQIRDSMTIVDTLVIVDTVPRPRLEIVIKILHVVDGTPFVYAIADTVALGADAATDAKTAAFITPVGNPAIQPSGTQTWKVAGISYNQQTARPNYIIVGMPALDTMQVTTGPRPSAIAATGMFLSSRSILSGIVIETVDFSESDSTMRISRFPANVHDTVESLSIVYKLYPGFLTTSSADRISFCNRRLTYRYGDYNHMDLSITVDPLDSLSGDGDINKGMIKIALQKMNQETCTFDGLIDGKNGLSGMLVEKDRNYQIFCDTLGNVQFGFIKSQ